MLPTGRTQSTEAQWLKKGNFMDLQELVSITENLTDECQRVLLAALKEILYRQKGSAKLKPCDELDRIVDIGILGYTDGRYAVPDEIKKRIRKLYTYLLRKFDIECYWDPHTGEDKTIPKGAEFVGTISPAGGIEIILQFPDDEVTAMLNLFGTNRCHNWPL